nr:DDE-type integrase/transposase/recombinase [Polynucleobacter sp. 78F-HAINBA]
MVLPIPELRLIRRLIDTIPAFDRSLARDGREAANKKYRSVLSHRITQAPLERAEIDHTQLDLMVVDGNGFPRGRPWLTVCLDDYSRSILGIVIGFEPPSFRTVAQCLKSAILPKVGLRSEFPEILNDWHSHGVMRELVVDNGVEFHSASLENACYALGIEIHYSARKTPWFKGKIERFLGTLNSQVAHGNPGTTFSNIFEKDDYDPVKHAVVRFETLKLVINKWVADVYHQETHRTLGASPSLVWVNSIDSSDILLPDNITQLDALLGHTEKRVLTHKGIEFSGLLYNSSELTGLRRRLGDKLKVDIRVDESNLGSIVVLSPDKKQMFIVPALQGEYANGLSTFQHRMCKKYAWRNFGKNDDSSYLEAKLVIAEIIEGESKSGRKKQRAKVARYQGDGILRQEDAPLVLDVPAKFIPGESDISEAIPGKSSFKSSNVDRKQRKFEPIVRERTSQLNQVHSENKENL